MKKVSLNKEVANIMDNLEELERPAIYKECPKEYQYKANGFKCNVDTSVMNLDDMKKLIASNVNRLNRAFTTPRSVIERRSNKFQQALAYISEHRHLVPLLVYVYNKSQGTTANYWKLAKDYAKKNGGMPAELIDNGERKKAKDFDMCRTEDFYNAVAQVPSFPKAWLQ
jgi:hypothetical protein